VQFRPFSEAGEYVRKLGLKSRAQWREYCKSGNKPKDIPSYPEDVYKSRWVGYGDWLGTGRIANQNKVYLPLEEAKKFVHSLGLRNQSEWSEYSKSGKKPIYIPSDPRKPYKDDWKGWGDWLGTGYVANQKREYRPFAEAQKFVRQLRLKSRYEWSEYCKSKNKPNNIPTQPRPIYKDDWKGWGDWLGTGYVANFEREYPPFEEARKIVHSFGLKSQSEWRRFIRSGKKPVDIPSNPARTYKKEWKVGGIGLVLAEPETS
jgi:Phage-integrase repeat unit